MKGHDEERRLHALRGCLLVVALGAGSAGCATDGLAATPGFSRLAKVPGAMIQMRRTGCASGQCPVYGVAIHPARTLVDDGGAPRARRQSISPGQMRGRQRASETKQVRVKAIESLGRIQPPTKETIEKLVALLDEPDQDCRRAALMALSHVGPEAKSAAPDLVDKLTGMLNDLKQDDTLRTAAHAALKKIDPRTKLAE